MYFQMENVFNDIDNDELKLMSTQRVIHTAVISVMPRLAEPRA